MKFILSILSVLLFSVSAHAQWPSITTTDLNEQVVSLPAKKAAVIGLAFSPKAQEDLVSWLEPLYKQLLDPNGTGSWVYDGEAYLVIAFTGAKKAAINKAKKQIQNATDKDFYSKVLLFEGSMSEFSALGINDKKEFYAFTVSPFGDILAKKQGRYTETKLDALCEPLEK